MDNIINRIFFCAKCHSLCIMKVTIITQKTLLLLMQTKNNHKQNTNNTIYEKYNHTLVTIPLENYEIAVKGSMP